MFFSVFSLFLSIDIFSALVLSSRQILSVQSVGSVVDITWGGNING